MTWSFVEYLADFSNIINERYPEKKDRNVENYIITFAEFPPVLGKFLGVKCPIKAEKLRIQGDAYFAIGKHEKAALTYTNCLTVSLPYSKCTAVAYANRSAALYSLKLFQECIWDLDRALDLPYPNDMRLKLISRKNSAAAQLESIALELANTSIAPVEELKLAHGENPKLPEVSQGIDLVYRPQDGKMRLVATMPFQLGDVLIIEEPYLMVLDPDASSKYCHHCLKKTLCVIPCDQCVKVYCSEKCRDDAYQSYHRIECRLQYTLLTSAPMNTPGLLCQLKCLSIFTEQGTNLQALYDDFAEMEENAEPDKLGFTGDQFIGNSRKGLIKWLVGVEMNTEAGALFEAGYLVTLLRNYTQFFPSNADMPTVARLIIQLGTAYIMNYYAIPYFGETTTKAHATYPLLGLVHHACTNNTITYIEDEGRLIMRASQDIKPGDQILFNYHDLTFSFDKGMHKSGRVLHCTRTCRKCDKNFVYPFERKPHIYSDRKLRSKLQKNPHDIEGLWKILHLLRGKHQHYTLQAQVVKTMLVEAYEGYADYEAGHERLSTFGLL